MFERDSCERVRLFIGDLFYIALISSQFAETLYTRRSLAYHITVGSPFLRGGCCVRHNLWRLFILPNRVLCSLEEQALSNTDSAQTSSSLPRHRRSGLSPRQLAHISPRLGVLNNIPFAIPFEGVFMCNNYIESN